ncbi:N2227-like protein-domain-containing protein [Halteromyces radiatus]|uniref:N2227-like protein-domain-containing protein n=1 Tax=Halteromyces radiatus TaxID=101107 RepID=UPI00221E67E6|nr:N2227-like protein-domain-containing protein [Halteromyces radiatus]KAI8096286.1 N2227-like protein-domain-containing protein [Halteromyces radiatus]
MSHQHHDHFAAHGIEDEDPAVAEKRHFQKVLLAFVYYRSHGLNHNHRRRRDFLALPEHHKRMIPDTLQKIDTVDTKIEMNARFFRDLVKSANLFSNNDMTQLLEEARKKGEQPPVKPSDMDKVRSTLKQCFRDWSVEGKVERDAIYVPIIEELESIYKSLSVPERGDIRVLVPGAGLGRLAYDIATHGFSCQGNEFTFYMLLASNFLLNNIEKERQYEIYPFVHSFSNLPTAASQLQPIRIPDVVPGNLPSTVDFSMVAGDFLEVYGEESDNQGAWDVVVTCFFIDTARNIIKYLEVIHSILKQGGTWINIGPLLYHFEDTPGESSVELSLDQIKRVAQEMGFEFKKESMIDTTYTSNPDSMLTYLYHSAFWTATKK